MTTPRLSTGVPGLDEKLGGGLIPGTTTALVGSSGAGKTQFGLQFLNAGLDAPERRRGILLDLTARGDSQNHAAYAKSLFGWEMSEESGERPFDPAAFFACVAANERFAGDYFHAFSQAGRRVTRRDLGDDAWREWKLDLTKRLQSTISFLYANFAQGARRLVVDGVEPVERQGESIQFELLEYVERQIVKKESAWVARDLFRQNFREFEAQIGARPYPENEIGTLFSYTAPETSLDALIEKPLEEGDFFAQANTVIYLGKIRDGRRFRRALYIMKHRGSACSDEILFYEIDDAGLKIVD